MKSWSFSIGLLLEYLLTFQLWRTFPGRAEFLVVGILAVIAMTLGLRRAARFGYFADRSDLVLHGLVIVDVALEGVSFELLHVASTCIFCAPADAGSFHDGYGFCWCGTILGLLVGGYHGWALRKSRRRSAALNPPDFAG